MMPPSDLIPVPAWSISGCHKLIMGGACADPLDLFIHRRISVWSMARGRTIYCVVYRQSLISVFFASGYSF